MLQYTVANWSGNVPKGVRLKYSDFLPKYCKTKAIEDPPEVREARLKRSLNALARATKPKD